MAAKKKPDLIQEPVRHMHPRSHGRIPYGAWVNLSSNGKQEFCLAKNLSMGGILLTKINPPPLGKQVRMVLMIHGDAQLMELHGTVVWRSDEEHGFGVQFSDLVGITKSRLSDLVEDAAEMATRAAKRRTKG